MIELNIKVKKLNPKAVIPTRAHFGDAGMDVTAISVNVTEDYIEYEFGINLD